MTDYHELLGCCDADLARVDPLVMNLLVARSIRGLADLDISRYERLADQWAEDVRPRELLGIFVGFRGRHMRDTGRAEDAERDDLLARHLFPRNRKLYSDAMELAIGQSTLLFEPGEVGSPQSLGEWLIAQYRCPEHRYADNPRTSLSRPFPARPRCEAPWTNRHGKETSGDRPRQ